MQSMQQTPVLNLQQIEELSTMVRGIQRQNLRDLQQIISQTVDIHHTSIINLYNLAVEQWHNKQKVIDNLCHFTLTMMNTIQLLWEKQYQQEDKIGQAQIVIGALEKNLGNINEQNDDIKARMSQAQLQLTNINEEKERIEDLYRSASCIAFESQKSLPNRLGQDKKCSACFDISQQLQKQKSQLRSLSSKMVSQKESVISQLNEQNHRLQQQLSTLKEEHELSKMQVQLAELAVKDALNYKSSYISMISNHNDVSVIQHKDRSGRRDFYGMGDEDSGTFNSHLLAFDLPINPESSEMAEAHCLVDRSQEEDEDISSTSLIRLETKEEKTTYQSPFRKKGQNTPSSQMENQQNFDESVIQNKNNLVIFQSNVDFTLSSAHQNSNQKQPSYSDINPSSRIKCSSRSKKGLNLAQPNHVSRPIQNLNPVQSVTSLTSNRDSNTSRDSDSSQISIGSIYSYFSNKVITNRIRRRK